MRRSRVGNVLVVLLLAALGCRLAGRYFGVPWLDTVGRVAWLVVLIPFLAFLLYVLIGYAITARRDYGSTAGDGMHD